MFYQKAMDDQLPPFNALFPGYNPTQTHLFNEAFTNGSLILGQNMHFANPGDGSPSAQDPTPLQTAISLETSIRDAQIYFSSIHSAFRYALLSAANVSDQVALEMQTSQGLTNPVYCPKCPAVFRRPHDLRRHMVYVLCPVYRE